MTDLTYTIAHIKVGAEKHWEEVGGFVSGDKRKLKISDDELLEAKEKVDNSQNNYGYWVNVYNEKYNAYTKPTKQEMMQKLDAETDLLIREYEALKKGLERNDNHQLSNFANELGAKIYGGVEDEKDFYLVMPTARDLKAGDFTKDFLIGFGEYVAWRRQYNYGFYCIQASNKEVMFIAYEKDYVFPKKGNIFQEYARIGIIENDLYKQFIK